MNIFFLLYTLTRKISRFFSMNRISRFYLISVGYYQLLTDPQSLKSEHEMFQTLNFVH